MYSREHRTAKNPSNNFDKPAPNRFAPRRFVVQPKTEEVTPQQDQTPEEQAQKEEPNQYKSGLIDGSKWRPGPPARTPRIQMKLTRLQPGDMYHQETVPSNPIAIQPQANTDLSPEQNPKLEPFEKAEEISNEAVEIQRLSESGASGDEDANSTNGGIIQRACSECETEKSLLSSKLTIGSTGDKYEQEADSMAERVMSMDTPTTNEHTIGRQNELTAHELTHVVQQTGGVQTKGEIDEKIRAKTKKTDSLSYSIQRDIGGTESSGKTDPKAIIPIANFIQYVQNVEKAYPNDKPSDIVTRIRVHYYSGVAFEQLIPRANTHDYIYSPSSFGTAAVPRRISKNLVGEDTYKYLTAHADENAKGDNPSPYILLPGGQKIDLGHLLLGLDALLHPETSVPYTTFDVPNIDPSSWVADIGIAAVWMTQHEESGKAPSDAPRKLSSPDLDAYYKLSAPTEDLLGDVDSFGVKQQWEGQPLSQAMREYYVSSSSGVKKRWQTFCSANGLVYTKAGKTIQWKPALRSKLITRVNTFNNLYGAGKLGTGLATLVSPIVSPSKRNWPHTPVVADKFLNWVKTNLEQELANGS